MTHPPDPALADSFANWAFFGFMFIIGLWRRRKQNEAQATNLAQKVDASIEVKVKELEEIVKELRSAQETGNTRVAIQTERMNHLDATMASLGERFDRIEDALPKTEDVLSKVLNVLERLKAGALVEKPLEKSGGLVKLKKEEK